LTCEKDWRVKTVRLQAAECRLPLPRPIRLGPVEIRTRDFVALRLTTECGLQGDAIGYPRGTPLLQTVEHIGRRFLGISPTQRKSAIEQFLASMVNGRPAFIRAVSLFDIALTDLAAKAVGLPLFRMLGGDRHRVPVMAVGGYYLGDRNAEDVRNEVHRRLDEGFARVKIMLDGHSADKDAHLVSTVSKIARGKLGVDVHWSWNSLSEAFETCRRIDDEGLCFIEDPFGAHRMRLMGPLQAKLRTPLACGEDMPDADALYAMANIVSVLRVDATTCGGFGAAAAVIQAAGFRGCEVLPHVHLPVHAQLAGAYSEISHVEIIPEETLADPVHHLLRRHPAIIEGILHVDEEPGAGTALNWDAVTQYAVATVDVEHEAAVTI
jgi:L-alanine-DL-glutamate epimerase-like enolase superfamily enzyme